MHLGVVEYRAARRVRHCTLVDRYVAKNVLDNPVLQELGRARRDMDGSVPSAGLADMEVLNLSPVASQESSELRFGESQRLRDFANDCHDTPRRRLRMDASRSVIAMSCP